MHQKMIYVRWVDSSVPEGTWLYTKDIDPALLQCCSVGFLVSETKDSIIIAGHRSMATTPQYSGIMVIPKCAIITRKCIRIPKCNQS